MYVSNIVVKAIAEQLRRVVREDELGIKQSLLDDPEARISTLELAVLVERALVLSSDPAFGLAVGWSFPVHGLRLLGPLLLSSATMREALSSLERYTSLVAEGMTWTLNEAERDAHLVYQQDCSSIGAARFASEFALSLAWRIMTHFLRRRDATPELVRWHHDMPLYARTYETRFNCTNLFKQPAYEIIFSRQLLDWKQPHADVRLYQSLCRWADAEMERRRREESVAERVRMQLAHSQQLAEVDFHALARPLQLTRGQLGRRLTRQGLSMTALVDEARCVRACQQLREGEQVGLISEALGFSEPSAFSRAFRRWMGMSPTQYRESLPELRDETG